jgi:hypothetical protein
MKIVMKYCVIGKEVNSGIGRNWFETVSGATEHAEALISGARGVRTELYVVRIVMRVRRIDPPIQVEEVE